jgi:eukaryotic-like serine/threonine-protein kinase
MASAAARLSAALAGRYRIERELGQGGMATVYLAHDLKHDRKVALKVLKPELAAVIGAERFLAEIKTTANLQHPHILPLHDSGEVDGTVFYVMPYVEGESLRDRLERERQLPIDDAIRITTEVAGALDYAHRHGVIHRDIKPENILLHDGQALVSDFGIALAAAQTGGNRLTETGMSLGTPTYMSPEQAMGERHINARSDVYALACVLYEMLTGDPPFTGSSAQAIVGKVLTEKPAPVRGFRDTVSPAIEAALMKALAKLPADRYASTTAFAAALTGPAPAPAPAWAAGAGRSYGRLFWPALAGVFLVAAVLAWLSGHRAPPAAVSPAVTFTLTTPANAMLADPTGWIDHRGAFSPDGATLVYAGYASDTAQTRRVLYRRALDGLDITPLAGTDSASLPAYSPDGKWIAFYTGSRLRKVPADGGAPVTIDDSVPGIQGLAWLGPDSLVFVRGASLWAIAADGGPMVRLNRDSLPEASNPAPFANGRAVAVVLCSFTCNYGRLSALDLATGKAHVLVSADKVNGVDVLAPDVLAVASADGTLNGLVVDPTTFTVRGAPIRLPIPVSGDLLRDASLVVSPTGTLAAIPEPGAAGGELVWVSRTGVATPITGRVQKYLFPRVSPDGTRIAMEIHDAADNGYIWVYDLRSGTFSRITDRGHSSRPVWSPDGKRLAYISLRGDSSGVYISPADRSGPERPLWIGPSSFDDLSWSPDGRWIATENTSATPVDAKAGRRHDADIFLLSTADGRRRMLLGGPGDQDRPVFSPDGKWLAYTSNESGRTEVYVTPFPGPAGRFPITSGGGSEPVWNSNGHHLFYRSNDGVLTDATLSFGTGVTVTARQPLFQMSFTGRFSSFGESPYDAAPGGQRFVMVRPTGNATSIIIATGWGRRALAAVRAAGGQ